MGHLIQIRLIGPVHVHQEIRMKCKSILDIICTGFACVHSNRLAGPASRCPFPRGSRAW